MLRTDGGGRSLLRCGCPNAGTSHLWGRSAKRGAARNRAGCPDRGVRRRSEEHTSELQSLMRISYAVFCLKKKKEIKKECNCEKREQRHIETKRARTRLRRSNECI